MKKLNLLLCSVCLFLFVFSSCSYENAPSGQEEPPITSNGGGAPGGCGLERTNFKLDDIE